MTTAIIGDLVFEGDSFDVHIPADKVNQIDEYLDDGECSSVKVYNVARLTSFDPRKILSKLNQGGSVLVYDLDCWELCYSYAMNSVDTKTLNSLMNPKVEVFHKAEDTVKALNKHGVHIMSERYYGFNYVITGVKNV